MATRADIESWLSKLPLGDKKAFNALYSATSAKLFGVILRILKDRAASEEVLQEVYVKVWRNAARYRAGGLSPMSWLITIARNAAVDRLRKRKSAGADASETLEDTLADPAPGPETLAIEAAGREALVACFGELEEDRGAAVRGAYLDGMSYAELAERHDVPLNTMRTWLRRSLIKLRECLTR